ncbi:MAG: 50S ribosomal protein L13 [Spirochaetales bacterium]|nr:50S ribosomal protein L13 [Spirochaetales bacterium]
MRTIFIKPKDIQKKWYIVDATDKILGRLCVSVANVLRGKNKPIFSPHMDCGDFVIIINAEKVKVTGRKLENKIYYRHTGYPGHLKEVTLGKVLKRRPEFPIENAIKGMLPKNRLGRKLFHNCKVYAGSNHPHTAQKPEILEV